MTSLGQATAVNSVQETEIYYGECPTAHVPIPRLTGKKKLAPLAKSSLLQDYQHQIDDLLGHVYAAQVSFQTLAGLQGSSPREPEPKERFGPSRARTSI